MGGSWVSALDLYPTLCPYVRWKTVKFIAELRTDLTSGSQEVAVTVSEVPLIIFTHR